MEIQLLPGFRFHPTDDELITFYLHPKTLDCLFTALAIGEADLRKLEPWDLPWIAKMGEEEWYFFCKNEKRYPTGQRTNRGTESGYWKATGKDKEIYCGKILVGMKKTLVFYKGRAPKGVKSNWVMHEFRLDGKYSKDNLPNSAQNEWVISKVFNKNSSGKKTHISALPKPNSQSEDINHHHQLQPESSNSLPPLMNYSPYNSSFETKPTISINQPPSFTPEYPISSSLPFNYYPDQLHYSDSFDQSIFKLLEDDNGSGNDLLASLKSGKLEDTGPSGVDDGGGGGDFGDALSADDPFDINYLFN